MFMFELPVTTIAIQIPDLQSPAMQQLQQQYNVNISFRQRQRGYGTTVIVRGSVYNEKLVKEATLKMMDLLLGKLSVSELFLTRIFSVEHVYCSLIYELHYIKF